MTYLDLIVKEFISFVDSLLIDYEVENDRIVIDRETFKEVLNRYGFLSFREKTKIYKTLNLIIHDKNNYTMPYLDKETNKTVRKVIINFQAYETLKSLSSKEFNMR